MTLVLVLLLAGAGAVGGWTLLSAPDGTAVGLDADLLPSWYPSDYRWIGAGLLVGFGVAPAVAAVLVTARSRWGSCAVAGLGTLLLLWMALQISLIGLILPPMQLGFVGLGLILVILGVRQRHRAGR